MGRTVLATDNIWFTLLTQNTNPIHFDHAYAAKTEFRRPLVDSTFTLALVTGQSVSDISQNAMANLGWDEVRLPNPVFEGDTIYSQSEVLEKRESESRPNVGIVRFKTTGFNEDGTVVIEFKRTIMVYKRDARARQPADQSAGSEVTSSARQGIGMHDHDVVVVGGGLTGLMAALQLQGRDVIVATKVHPTQSHSGAAQGGFNAARSASDSAATHAADTIKGSDYLADQDAVEVMCEEAPDVIDELDRLGVMWSRTEQGTIARSVRSAVRRSRARATRQTCRPCRAPHALRTGSAVRDRRPLGVASARSADRRRPRGGRGVLEPAGGMSRGRPREGRAAGHRRARAHLREDDQRPRVERATAWRSPIGRGPSCPIPSSCSSIRRRFTVPAC